MIIDDLRGHSEKCREYIVKKNSKSKLDWLVMRRRKWPATVSLLSELIQINDAGKRLLYS